VGIVRRLLSTLYSYSLLSTLFFSVQSQTNYFRKLKMTIKGLWQYLDKNKLLTKFTLAELAGKLIAIDAHYFFNASRCYIKARYLKKINPFFDPIDEDKIDKLWIAEIYRRVKELLGYKCIPVFVYDNNVKDPLKMATLAKRKKNEVRAEDKIKILMAKVEEGNRFSVTPQDISNLRSLSVGINRMPRDSLNKAIEFLKGIGLPWVMSTGEGERTCALLTRDGPCWAAMTRDGDAVAAGAVRVLKERNIESKAESELNHYLGVRLDDVVKHLEVSFDTFQEMCIFAGTDFGEMKGIAFATGVKKMEKLDAYTFEKLKKKGVDISDYDYKEIRKRFEVVPWEETVSDFSFNLVISKSADREVLEEYDLKDVRYLNSLKKSAMKAVGRGEE
jgi:5'-3' exonuclease